ncbi:hypothetical protein GH714_005632 [Hevea brasiliensis]|uniref:Retrotransposon gag domain-containing protein n=1 Tax=Hevea brasiliensis TaxID=3981 RepID=A0A6A6K9U4_HEVBR|nr:hypothetical protein GH714_005632 [Hevea brasiliensis]
MADMEKGTCSIKTWDEFKREPKKQFYPENAADEARAKLRRLTQKGTIREYVKEFSEVLLEISDYPNQEALFSFKDGLQTWVKLEIERRGAQDFAAAIAIAESLIEFKKVDKAKNKDSKGKNGGDKGGGKESNKEGPKEGNDKKFGFGKKDTRDGKFKKFEKSHKPTERPPLKCFWCDGPHRARECPKNAALTALVGDKEESHPRREGSSMGSLQLAVVAKGASDNFLKLEEARRLSIAFHKQVGWLKAINSKPTPTHGVTNKVAVKLGEWTGLIDFSIVSMNDYACVLGMNFMDRVRAIPIPFVNSLCIVEDVGAFTIPLKRRKVGSSTLSALQLAKGVKRVEPTYLVALQAEEGDCAVEVPHEVQNVLQEFGDDMPKELPKQLPPKREVDHSIELLPGAKRPIGNCGTPHHNVGNFTLIHPWDHFYWSFSVNYGNNVGYHCDLARGFAHSQRRSIVAFDLSRDTDDLRCGRTGQCFWKVTEVAIYFGNNNSTWTGAYNWSSVASTNKDNKTTTQPRPWPKASLP